jgi:hypothetical protein
VVVMFGGMVAGGEELASLLTRAPMEKPSREARV